MQKLLEVKTTPTVYIFVRDCFSKRGQAYYPKPNNIKSRQQHIGQTCGILIITALNITLLLPDPNPPMAHPSAGTMAWMGNQTLISHFVPGPLHPHTTVPLALLYHHGHVSGGPLWQGAHDPTQQCGLPLAQPHVLLPRLAVTHGRHAHLHHCALGGCRLPPGPGLHLFHRLWAPDPLLSHPPGG